ncbi:MAG: hypothetical protein A2252_08720 [Elusimicrobia bacterium RIFOXYA2_FULL_39_19]|nr:MAG: hypothetical protein A2252_08720 [Elusimicrobia bacterium RIFOXYA2_FULL_39_19]
MKILLINFLDKRYGSTYRARQIFRCLKEINADVKYIESNSSIEGAVSIPQADNGFGYLVAMAIRSFYCLFLSYDVIYIQKFILPAVPCIAIAKFRRKKVYVDWDDLDSDFQRTQFRKNITKGIEAAYPKKASLITVHNEYLKKHAQNAGAKDVRLLNQIVDTVSFDPDKYDSAETKIQLNLKNKVVAGFLCTLTHGGAADLDIIAEAMNEAVRKYPQLFFLIIGGGPLETSFKESFEGRGLRNYRITGLLKQEDVPKYVSACDFCMVYMRDNPGNKMRMSFKTLEYLAMNKTVVGNFTGETLDKLGPYCIHTGLRAEDFVKVIGKVIDTGNFLAPHQARKYILENHSIETMKTQLKEIFG